MNQQELLELSLVFHRHKCPAMPMGLRASLAAMEAPGVERTGDSALVALGSAGRKPLRHLLRGWRASRYRLHFRKRQHSETALRQVGPDPDRQETRQGCSWSCFLSGTVLAFLGGCSTTALASLFHAVYTKYDTLSRQHGNSSKPLLPRDQNLRRIRRVGRKRWKQATGYHRRSLAETAVFRFKIIFSNTLSARTLPRQITGAWIKCATLSRMMRLGTPNSYPVT
jgi:hypothetical protein